MLWLAYVSGAFGLAASGQINFLVPLRARELGASFEVIGLMVGAGAALPALVSVMTGAAIDRLGARGSFVLGTTATGILAACSVFVTNYWWYLLLQPVLGVARNFGWLASQAYITGVGTEQQRHAVAGRFAFFTSAGQMAAPAMIGAVAQLTGFRWAFLFLTAYSGAFAIVGWLLPPIARSQKDTELRSGGLGVRSAVQLVKQRPIQVVLLLSGLRLWITWIYTAFMPIYLVDNGLAPVAVGTVLAMYGIVGALAAPTTTFWMRFASAPTVGTLAMTGGALALILAPHLTALPLVYLAPVLIGVSQGVSLPVILAIVGASTPAGQRGVALGLRATINQATAAAGPILVGALISAFGVVAGFTTGGLFAGLMVLSAHVLHRSAGGRTAPETPAGRE